MESIDEGAAEKLLLTFFGKAMAFSTKLFFSNFGVFSRANRVGRRDHSGFGRFFAELRGS